MEVIEVIRRLAYRPLKSVTLEKPYNISVKFENGDEYCFPVSVHLLIFASLIQNAYFEPIVGSTSHCVCLPLDFFKFLGFQSGDAIQIHNVDGIEQSILFS